VTLDCRDIDAVGAFWSALLEGSLGDPMDDGRFVFLRDRGDLPTFCLQRVSEPKMVKNRMHPDFEVDDLETTTARILELGGSWPGAENTLEQYRWRTVLDPERNEFDITVVERASRATGHTPDANERMNAASRSTPSTGIAL
jgi:predicted enzyme related to lactoylglutathione lyase